MGDAGRLGDVHPDHILKQLEQRLAAAAVEIGGGLGPLGGEARPRGDPLGKVGVLHQLFHRPALKDPKVGLPQVVDGELVGRMGEQDARRLHRTQQRGGKDGVHLRILEPRLELGQLGPPFLAQGQVGAAANVAAVQVAGGQAVADQMQLKGLHAQCTSLLQKAPCAQKFCARCQGAHTR